MTQNQNKDFYSILFSIAVPIALQSLITNAVNLADVFMISSLDTPSIGGVSMANKIFFLLLLFLFGANSGAAILVAQYYGSQDFLNIKKTLGVSIVVGSAGALLLFAGSFFAPEKLISLLAPGEIAMIREGSKYLRVISISFVFTAISTAYSFALRATHDAKLPMVITSITLLINVFFNWVLIFGKLGAPELGVLGAAIATLTARIVEMILIIFFVYRFDLVLAGTIKEIFGFSKAFFIHYISTVGYVILNEVIWSLGVVGYSFVYGRMGEVATASMAITQPIEQLAFVVFFGICNASGVMLGNELGANNLEQAKAYAKKFIRLVFVAGIITSAMIYLTSPFIAGIFKVDEIVKINVVNCLKVFSFYVTFKVINMVIIVGILRSGGDTIASMILDLVGVWVIGIPMGILGGLYLKLDIQYVYAMILFEEFAKLIFCYYRYKKYRWVKNLVFNTPD